MDILEIIKEENIFYFDLNTYEPVEEEKEIYNNMVEVDKDIKKRLIKIYNNNYKEALNEVKLLVCMQGILHNKLFYIISLDVKGIKCKIDTYYNTISINNKIFLLRSQFNDLINKACRIIFKNKIK